jgi:hypothetical protein
LALVSTVARWFGEREMAAPRLGHYSVVVTERYAHLRTDLFAERDLNTIALDLRPGAAETKQIGVKTESEAEAPARKGM